MENWGVELHYQNNVFRERSGSWNSGSSLELSVIRAIQNWASIRSIVFLFHGSTGIWPAEYADIVVCSVEFSVAKDREPIWWWSRKSSFGIKLANALRSSARWLWNREAMWIPNSIRLSEEPVKWKKWFLGITEIWFSRKNFKLAFRSNEHAIFDFKNRLIF